MCQFKGNQEERLEGVIFGQLIGPGIWPIFQSLLGCRFLEVVEVLLNNFSKCYPNQALIVMNQKKFASQNNFRKNQNKKMKKIREEN